MLRAAGREEREREIRRKRVAHRHPQHEVVSWSEVARSNEERGSSSLRASRMLEVSLFSLWVHGDQPFYDGAASEADAAGSPLRTIS